MTGERRAGILLIVLGVLYLTFFVWCAWFVVQRHRHDAEPRGPPPAQSVRGKAERLPAIMGHERATP